MTSPDPSRSPPSKAGSPSHLSDQIGAKVTRKLVAQRRSKSVWYGFGLFGLVGWSVAIPSLMGIALGIWIDRHVTSPYSWTLMGLISGVVLGCLNAWYWVEKESQSRE